MLDGSKPAEVGVDQLVGAFSADPSLIAFAQFCCDSNWNSRPGYLLYLYIQYMCAL